MRCSSTIPSQWLLRTYATTVDGIVSRLASADFSRDTKHFYLSPNGDAPDQLFFLALKSVESLLLFPMLQR